MITVYLQGGLGNILFQYAAGSNLAVRNNTSLRLDLSHYIGWRDMFAHTLIKELGHFRLNAELFVPSGLRKAINCFGMRNLTSNAFFEEKHFGYDPAVLKLGDGSSLSGYFQSEKYFQGIEPDLRKELQLKAPFSDRSVSDYEKKISDSNSVAIHIRRGDYLKKALHNVCTKDYYARSIEYMRESLAEPCFFIFSDDIEWCRANIGFGEYDFVVINTADQRLADFYLMSLCKHVIISNSSFSWWAAWLNSSPDKIIVSPDRWFNDEIMNAQALRDTIPGSWIRVEV